MRLPQRHRVRVLPVLALALLLPATSAVANASHAGWPRIDGMLLMNKQDQSRPLDGRPGRDPFGGTDPEYRCDGLHKDSTCVGLPRHCRRAAPRCRHAVVVADAARHNELLGGHGNDTIHAGPWGDVIWGDFKPSGQPTTQVDRLFGGPGRDFIYAAHGWNTIWTGGGRDVVHAHFGRGIIHCNSRTALVYLSHRSLRRYRLDGCPRVSFRTTGH